MKKKSAYLGRFQLSRWHFSFWKQGKTWKQGKNTWVWGRYPSPVASLGLPAGSIILGPLHITYMKSVE